jgi:hypothetical protein
MILSRSVRYVVTIAFAAGATTVMLGAEAAHAGPSGCAQITGHLADHGRTVTAIFHVPVTCEEVSVLSWFASGPDGQEPQKLLDRVSQDNVPPGDYRWTIAAPPAKCFRQLDLRVPGHNVDSFQGGRRLCSSSTSPTTAPTVPSTTTTTSTTAPPAVLPDVVTPPALVAGSTTTSPEVLGEVINAPAPTAQLPNTGGRVGDEAALALMGIGLGASTLIARRWHRRRFLEPQRF